MALMMLITAIGIWRLHTVAEATREMMEAPLATERMISDWSRYITSGVQRATAIAKSADLSLGAFFRESSVAASKTTTELQKHIEALLQTEEEKTLFNEIGEKRKVFLSSRDAIVKFKTEGNVEETKRIFEQTFAPASNNYLELTQKLLGLQRKKIDAIAMNINSVNDDSRNLLIALGAMALIFGAVCAWLLTIGITRPLRRAVQVARTVASGDLTR